MMTRKTTLRLLNMGSIVNRYGVIRRKEQNESELINVNRSIILLSLLSKIRHLKVNLIRTYFFFRKIIYLNTFNISGRY